MIVGLLAVALLLVALNLQQEGFVDPDQPVTRPERNAEWLSKIDAQAPMGGNDDDYIRVLQSFYDSVYVPADVKPKDTDVETFLKNPSVVGLGLDEGSLRKIIANGFRVELTGSAAAREQKEMKFQPTEALFPSMGVDEVRTRTEEEYAPADTRKSTEFSEGVYEPTTQQNVPRNPGEYKERSIGATKQKFYSVCKGSACTENVL